MVGLGVLADRPPVQGVLSAVMLLFLVGEIKKPGVLPLQVVKHGGLGIGNADHADSIILLLDLVVNSVMHLLSQVVIESREEDLIEDRNMGTAEVVSY